MTPEKIYSRSFKASRAFFRITASPKGLYALDFGSRSRGFQENNLTPSKIHRILLKAELLLKKYLAGQKAHFGNLPVDWSGYKPFERCVLRYLRKIPHGRTESYQVLALRSGRPRAARYVGKVLGLNRLPIILPCHRVVRKDGALGGFSRGIRWKKELLKLEGAWDDKKSQHEPTL